MRKIYVILSMILLITLIHCENDNGISENLMEGRIGGVEWEFQYAKAFYSNFGDEYMVEIFGQRETPVDPCSVNSILGYISLTIPNETGFYPLPFADASESLKFHQPGVGQDFFLASSGFVEVFSIEGRRVGGFIQATFDDDNTVEGTFVFDRCN